MFCYFCGNIFDSMTINIQYWLYTVWLACQVICADLHNYVYQNDSKLLNSNILYSTAIIVATLDIAGTVLDDCMYSIFDYLTETECAS